MTSDAGRWRRSSSRAAQALLVVVERRGHVAVGVGQVEALLADVDAQGDLGGGHGLCIDRHRGKSFLANASVAVRPEAQSAVRM